MIASSFLDPVIGVDVHFELVPTPAPVPMPIPNPFTGIVFDPVGLVVGIALGAAIGAVTGAPFQGPVIYWGAFPATNTGTEAKHVPGHILIPPGTAWAPFPKTPKPVIHPGETPKPALPVVPEDDAVMITGSKTVSVMGSNAVRIGDLALSCSEPLRLPSSVVLAVPKGAPILVGGPPSLDIMAAVMASLRTRFVSDSLHALLSRMRPSRLRSLLHRGVCFLTGHPVDVASGKVMTSKVDLRLPGPLPLVIERHYNSAFASRQSSIGWGWSWTLDQAIWRERGKVVALIEDGRELEFDCFDLPDHVMRRGDVVRHPIDGLSLRCLGQDRWELEGADGTTRSFGLVAGDASGRARLLEHRSRCRLYAIRLGYDERGRLAVIHDAVGRELRLEHDGGGRITGLSVPTPSGEGHYPHRRFHYDERGDLVAVVDAAGARWRFEYTTHLLTSEYDRTGLGFHFVYDGLGADAWCVRTWGDGGLFDHLLAYDKQNKQTFVTNSLGHTTGYRMNVVGAVVEVVDPLGGVTRYEYDPETLARTAIVDPLGGELRLAYDERGRLSRAREPDGGVVQIVYAGDQLPARIVDRGGGEWQRAYDQLGNLVARRSPDGHVTRYVYTRGWLTAIVGPDGTTTRIGYDGQANVAQLERPGGALERRWHDALGRVIAVRDPDGHEQRRHYDLEGRLVGLERSGAEILAFEYDAEGRITRAVEGERVVEFRWGGYGRLVERREAEARVMLEYDSEDQLRAMTREDGRRYELELDARGELVVEREWDGSERCFVRDALGRIVERHEADGSVERLVYGPGGQVVEQHGPAGVLRFRYGQDGRLRAADNGTCEVEFERDALGNIVAERSHGAWVRAGFDHRGLPTAVETSFGAAWTIGRDAAGRAVELDYRRDAVRHAVRYERDYEGRVQRRSAGELGVVWEQDPAGRPTRQHASHREHQLVERRYSWAGGGPDSGRITAIDDAVHGSTRCYHDARGRLASVVHGDGSETARAYDAVGNLYARADFGDREYDPRGALLRVAERGGARCQRYDERGQLVERIEADGCRWSYEWSGPLLTAVVEPDGRRTEFGYDAFARRVERRCEGRTTRWLWWGDTAIACWEQGSDDEVEALEHRVFEPESFTPLLYDGSDGPRAVISDHRGVPLALIDDAGQVVGRGDELIPGSAGADTHWAVGALGLPGQELELELGLAYNRYRWFDLRDGIYASPDPLRLGAGPWLYAYAFDPLIGVDPLGLALVEIFRAVADAELADIRDVGFFRNSYGSSAGKYFAYTMEEAMGEARMLSNQYGGRYTIVSTLVPERFFEKSIHHLEVDGGIRTAHVGDWLEFDLLRISKKNGVTIHNQSCP